MDTIIVLIFQALAFASILYLISAGLSVTMGLMGFANLAHGIFAMYGGYLAAVAIASQGVNWWAMLVAAPLLVAAASLVLERTLYARLYGAPELDQVLFCIGLMFVATAVAKYLFGPIMIPLPIPVGLQGSTEALGLRFLNYKILVVAAGCLVAAFTLIALERTRFGAMVRAAVENRGMAESIGLRSSRLFTITFAMGSFLAALGGILGADVFSLTPTYAFDNLVYFMIVVAIAGLGTVRGAFIAALIVGSLQTAVGYALPELGTIALFAMIFLLLLARPQGLFGRV